MTSSEQRVCRNCAQGFTIEPEDFDFYNKIAVPPPTWCPTCRLRRRFAFRNERFIYKRKSEHSGKEIFAMSPGESHQKVYENEAWFSDIFDPAKYARDVDFSRPFLTQLYDLWKEVPVFALSVVYGVNSDYSNNYTGFKNCYLVFNGNYVEDCLYGNGTNYTKNSVDFSHVDKSEFCYESTFSADCSRIFHSTRLRDCYNMWFSKKCAGCHDCFGCINLKNKSYHIFNEPYSKEEYEKKLKEFGLSSRTNIERLKKETADFWQKFPNKYAENNRNENSSGSYVYNCKNTKFSYLVQGSEDSKYCQHVLVPPTKECYDYTVWGDRAELTYETVASGMGLYNARFCFECWPENKNLEYSLYCANSSNLFGCVGVKKKEYCILNKQYSKEEFEVLRERIIAHMSEMPYRDREGREYPYGEFLPMEFSPYPYNHTLAQEQFPIDKEKAGTAGLFWKDPDTRTYEANLSWRDLPDSIADVDDSILQKTILCAAWDSNEKAATLHNCTKAFRITPQELQFYRQFDIPIPQKCYNTRHFERIAQRLPAKLSHRRCQCTGTNSENGTYHNFVTHPHGTAPCSEEFETPYPADSSDIIYCESCFNAETA